MKHHRHTPGTRSLELLAPAGSIESFFAAIESGADAVYCGLKEFSARAKAKNFSIEEIGRMSSYARWKGRRLYVALNTLIKETELPRLIEMLSDLENCGIDGLIIQDLGVQRLARDHFPNLSLHASTQMAVHNAGGVRMLEKMGFDRAVLARELTLEEISSIRRQTTIELEQFIHGALCYSISGQCFFSSYLSGKSGNRGRCAQPCRRRYHHRNRSGFHFSTSDLCAVELLPRLIDAGVMSFKIEGRMKNAEYVATVVSAYRKALDGCIGGNRDALREAGEMLAESFGRVSTTGFFKGKVDSGIALASRKGGLGKELGTIKKTFGNDIYLETREVLHIGDRLRIQPANDQAGVGFTIKELFLGKHSKKRVEPGSFVRIPTPFDHRFQPGDTAYKTATGKVFTSSEQACLKQLDSAPLPVCPIRLTIACRDDCLTLEARWDDGVCSGEYPVEMQPADRSPLNRDTLEKNFGKTGHPGLLLQELKAGDLPPVVIAPSRLNEIRRDFFEHLVRTLDQAIQDQRRQRISRIQATLLPYSPPSPGGSSRITVRVSGIRELVGTEIQNADEFLIPLTPANVQAVLRESRQLKPLLDRITWDIPSIIYEAEWLSYQTAVHELQKREFHSFRLNNLGHFHLFPPDSQAGISSGHLLYALNSNAVLALKELGVTAFQLSMEDDRNNMAQLLGRKTGLTGVVAVYSPVPVLTSRIPMRMKDSRPVLENDAGDSLQLDFSTGLTVVYGGRDFSLLGRMEELKRMGGENFLLDLSRPGIQSGQEQLILDTFRNDAELPETTSMNFDRGLE